MNCEGAILKICTSRYRTWFLTRGIRRSPSLSDPVPLAVKTGVSQIMMVTIMEITWNYIKLHEMVSLKMAHSPPFNRFQPFSSISPSKHDHSGLIPHCSRPFMSDSRNIHILLNPIHIPLNMDINGGFRSHRAQIIQVMHDLFFSLSIQRRYSPWLGIEIIQVMDHHALKSVNFQSIFVWLAHFPIETTMIFRYPPWFQKAPNVR